MSEFTPVVMTNGISTRTAFTPAEYTRLKFAGWSIVGAGEPPDAYRPSVKTVNGIPGPDVVLDLGDIDGGSSGGGQVAYSKSAVGTSLYLSGTQQIVPNSAIYVPASDGDVWIEWKAALNIITGGQASVRLYVYEITNGGVVLRGSVPKKFFSNQPASSSNEPHTGQVNVGRCDTDRMFGLWAAETVEGSSFHAALFNIPLFETEIWAVVK